jgi:hypothetical protein
VLTLVLLRLAYLPRRLCKVLLLDIFPAWRRKRVCEMKTLLVK